MFSVSFDKSLPDFTNSMLT